MEQRRLFRLLWLSIAAAVATITLKLTAWALTGSVGLLSDAAESVVNLVAAVVAMAALRWAVKPADEDHAYGHAKAEYFSAGVEGAMILVAAAVIAVTAVDRLLDPQPLESVGIGLPVSAAATAINLRRRPRAAAAGRRARSIVLEADGKHLITDVWTSVGVIVGVAGVALTGWERLDPIIALAVAANILVAGRRAAAPLRRRPDGPRARGARTGAIREVLAQFERDGVRFHALRTRQAGSRRFVSVHVLVPGAWTVQRGHDLVEQVEGSLCSRLPGASVFTHLEPAEDPRSFADTTLDRPR